MAASSSARARCIGAALLFAAAADASALAWPPASAGWTGFVKPAWFGSNTSGLDSDATLALMARHAVAGYAWTQGHGPGRQRVGREEALLAAAATHARDYFARAEVNASTVLFVYRQVQVAVAMFAACQYANVAPETANFWLTNSSGARCLAEQPWRTFDAMWNFSQPGATDWWIGSVIAELTSESALTNYGGVPGAVFFDEVGKYTLVQPRAPSRGPRLLPSKRIFAAIG
jgi:hypothetical protein